MTIEERLAKAFGTEVVASDPMTVGFGLTGLRVTLADGRVLAIKARQSVSHADLRLEGYMLGGLARQSELPVPRVYLAEPDLLAMDYLENDGGPITPNVERHAAELIAALHATPCAFFGYERDTLIGPLPQPNPRSEKWIPFFREHRLLAMAEAAEAEGRLPSAMLSRLERLGERLEDLLTEPAHPSLLHGDLWTGNVLVRGDRIAGFVDPAIYYGHPEIELAFTTMFGTFGEAFFEAYEALLPIKPGFHELRREIYNLYPTLVHLRLFGQSYLGGIERILARLGV